MQNCQEISFLWNILDLFQEFLGDSKFVKFPAWLPKKKPETALEFVQTIEILNCGNGLVLKWAAVYVEANPTLDCFGPFQQFDLRSLQTHQFSQFILNRRETIVCVMYFALEMVQSQVLAISHQRLFIPLGFINQIFI